MKIYPFGAPDAPVLLLLPGTCCHWKGNFGAVIGPLAETFRVLCVSYDGFDETEQTEFPTMLEETERIEAYLLAHCYELLHRLGMENSKNLAQVGEIATQASLLREDIDRYFTSVTYRAGRLVTALPRKVAALLRRKG